MPAVSNADTAGVSSSNDRPQGFVRRGESATGFSHNLVWKFDRFARSVSHLLKALETFKAQGIEFVSFSEQLDTEHPSRKDGFHDLDSVAELERSLTVERVKAGLRNAKVKGKRLGRPKKILDTKRIATLRAKGVGWKRIAAELGVGVGTIYRVTTTKWWRECSGVPEFALYPHHELDPIFDIPEPDALRKTHERKYIS
jgi:DNA invertase Pin-like site-specific DNA recombinase